MASGTDPVGIIDIEMVGDFDQVVAMINHLQSRLTYAEMSLFLEDKIAPYLIMRTKNRFASEGDDVSGSWAPLSPATQAIRAWGRGKQLWSVGDSHPINQRTGEMYDYLVHGLWEPVPSGASGVRLSSPTSKQNNREMRARLKQAAGGGRGPARPVLGLNEADLLFFLTSLAFHLQDQRVSP